MKEYSEDTCAKNLLKLLVYICSKILFKSFLQRNGIKHTLVPPYHPASNGLAERNVNTVKSALKKHQLAAMKTNPHATREERLDSFLLMYRTTPHATTGRSPAELFLKRKPKTRFDPLKPDLSRTIKASQDTQKRYHNGPKSSLREFHVGEVVRVKNVLGGVQKYVKGAIAKRLGPLNYLVKVGFRYRYTHVDRLIRSGEAGVSPEDCEEYLESATGWTVGSKITKSTNTSASSRYNKSTNTSDYS